jgi:hypothetical protein
MHPLPPSNKLSRTPIRANTLALLMWSRNREIRNEDKSQKFIVFFPERMKQFSDWNSPPHNNCLRQSGTKIKYLDQGYTAVRG